jgi:hypothetical protein
MPVVGFTGFSADAAARYVAAFRSALTQGQRARFEFGSNARTGRPMAIDLELLEPIISPKVTPTEFRPERSSREIAEAAFTKR